MKLLLATPLFPPEIGGPATYAEALVEGLPGRGVEVEVVKFSDVRHMPKFLRHYAYYRRVLEAARSADVVLALDPVSTGYPAQWAARKAGKPFVVKIVGDYAWEQGRQRFGISDDLDTFISRKRVPFPVWLLRKVETGAARFAARVIVPSEYLKRVVTSWGIAGEKIDIIPNAVPDMAPGEVPSAVSALPRPLVVTVGRLVPWKRVDGVIDAVAGVLGASLAIVGEGPERAALTERASEKLPGRALFTGALPHPDTLAVMKSADVLVLNSSYEGLSHLLIEALMLGTPVIATNVGGNPEVITDNEDGLLVSPKDPHALSNALARLLGDEALSTRLSLAAEASAKRFSTETMLAKTVALLTSL